MAVADLWWCTLYQIWSVWKIVFWICIWSSLASSQRQSGIRKPVIENILIQSSNIDHPPYANVHSGKNLLDDYSIPDLSHLATTENGHVTKPVSKRDDDRSTTGDDHRRDDMQFVVEHIISKKDSDIFDIPTTDEPILIYRGPNKPRQPYVDKPPTVKFRRHAQRSQSRHRAPPILPEEREKLAQQTNLPYYEVSSQQQSPLLARPTTLRYPHQTETTSLRNDQTDSELMDHEDMSVLQEPFLASPNRHSPKFNRDSQRHSDPNIKLRSGSQRHSDPNFKLSSVPQRHSDPNFEINRDRQRHSDPNNNRQGELHINRDFNLQAPNHYNYPRKLNYQGHSSDLNTHADYQPVHSVSLNLNNETLSPYSSHFNTEADDNRESNYQDFQPQFSPENQHPFQRPISNRNTNNEMNKTLSNYNRNERYETMRDHYNDRSAAAFRNNHPRRNLNFENESSQRKDEFDETRNKGNGIQPQPADNVQPNLQTELGQANNFQPNNQKKDDSFSNPRIRNNPLRSFQVGQLNSRLRHRMNGLRSRGRTTKKPKGNSQNHIAQENLNEDDVSDGYSKDHHAFATTAAIENTYANIELRRLQPSTRLKINYSNQKPRPETINDEYESRRMRYSNDADVIHNGQLSYRHFDEHNEKQLSDKRERYN